MTLQMFLCAILAAIVLLVVFSALLQKIHSIHPDFRLSFKDIRWRLPLPNANFLSGIAPGNPRDICVGGNASLGEVEDILCMVSCHGPFPAVCIRILKMFAVFFIALKKAS